MSVSDCADINQAGRLGALRGDSQGNARRGMAQALRVVEGIALALLLTGALPLAVSALLIGALL